MLYSEDSLGFDPGQSNIQLLVCLPKGWGRDFFLVTRASGPVQGEEKLFHHPWLFPAAPRVDTSVSIARGRK